MTSTVSKAANPSSPVPAKRRRGGPKVRLNRARLRAHRESRGWTREFVAVRVPCSAAQIAALELGYRDPAEEDVPSLAAAYGLRLDEAVAE